MCDQQILDLAAKAAMHAGLKLECPDELDGVYVSRCFGRSGYTWNPLEDDGDALRLAVRLGFIVDVDLEEMRTHVSFTFDDQDQELFEGHGHCALRDTRVAIVRAAAEIGKAMQEGK